MTSSIKVKTTFNIKNVNRPGAAYLQAIFNAALIALRPINANKNRIAESHFLNIAGKLKIKN